MTQYRSHRTAWYFQCHDQNHRVEQPLHVCTKTSTSKDDGGAWYVTDGDYVWAYKCSVQTAAYTQPEPLQYSIHYDTLVPSICWCTLVLVLHSLCNLQPSGHHHGCTMSLKGQSHSWITTTDTQSFHGIILRSISQYFLLATAHLIVYLRPLGPQWWRKFRVGGLKHEGMQHLCRACAAADENFFLNLCMITLILSTEKFK